MSGLIKNRFSSVFRFAALLGVMAISTHAFAQYKSGGHIKRSHGSGGYSHGSSGSAGGYVKPTRSYNAKYGSSGLIQSNNANRGLKIKSHGQRDALRSGVRLGNQGNKNRGFSNRKLKSASGNFNNNNSRRIQRVKNKRGYTNEGYSNGTNPRNQRNVRRTNQLNSDSDLYYIDQFGYSVISSNNKNISDGYYDDDFRESVVIQGDGGSPACPQGHDCGYRLYDDGSGPRIITLGSDLEGLPPQDGLNGGPKVITLGK